MRDNMQVNACICQPVPSNAQSVSDGLGRAGLEPRQIIADRLRKRAAREPGRTVIHGEHEVPRT